MYFMKGIDLAEYVAKGNASWLLKSMMKHSERVMRTQTRNGTDKLNKFPTEQLY